MEIDFIVSENFQNFSLFCTKFSVLKIISAIFLRKPVCYVPKNVLWLNRLFLTLAGKNGKSCLIIDWRGINWNSPGKADNVEEQVCYLNVKTNNKL